MSNITWSQIMIEFNRMSTIDQNRAIMKPQMKWIAEICEKIPIRRGLDLGFGTGFSAICMEKGGCEVISINNERTDIARRIEAIERYKTVCNQMPIIISGDTDRVLPQLANENQKFGLIFVDAGHRFEQVFIDVYYSANLCLPGGILALDDTYYGGILSVVNWVNSNLSHIWKPFQILKNTISWKRTSLNYDTEGPNYAHRYQSGPPIFFHIIDKNADEFMYKPCGDLAAELGFTLWESDDELDSLQ